MDDDNDDDDDNLALIAPSDDDDNDDDDDDGDDNLALIAPSVRLSSSTDPQSPRLKISCSSAHGYHHCPHIICTIMLKTPDAE